MKCTCVAVLATLLVHASGTRVTRTGAAPTRGLNDVLCANTTQRRAIAAKSARDQLQSLASRMQSVNGTVAKLTKDLASLAAKIKAAESAQADATSIRQKEKAQFTAETKEVKELVDSLQKAIGVAGGNAQQGPGAAAAVDHVLQALAGFGSAKPAQLSLLRTFASAREGRGPAPAAVQGVLVELHGGFSKELKSAEHEEQANRQHFEAQMADSQARLRALEDEMEQKQRAKRELEAALAHGEQDYASSNAQLRANAALFDKVEAHCRVKPPSAGFRNHLRAEAKPGKHLATKVVKPSGTAELFRQPDAKELESLKEQMVGMLANFADAGSAQRDPTLYGPYDMESQLGIPISGFYGCSSPYKGNIYLPIARSGGPTPPAAPIISFSHAYALGGYLVDDTHRDTLFAQLVAMGFAIVAHQTGGLFNYCDASWDQIRMITWAQTSSYASRIDFTKAVLMGYSMGGRASLKNAADASIVAANNIVSVVAFVPHCNYGCGVPVTQSHFFTGSADISAPYAFSKTAWNNARQDKIFALISGMTHIPTVNEWLSVLTPDTAYFVACTVWNDAASCTTAFDKYMSCKHGCEYCDCAACDPCIPCWGTSPPAWCESYCTPCDPCNGCQECSQCNNVPLFMLSEATVKNVSKVIEPRGDVVAALPGGTHNETSFPVPDAKTLAEIRKETFYALVADSVENESAAEGSYGMESVTDIPITGFHGCSAPFKGNVYLPKKASGPVPVITFAHGFTEGGKLVDRMQRNRLFAPLVGMGFAVVAHQTGGALDYCDSSHDQLQMLDWARGSPYASRLDFGRVVLMGYSMGGRATLKNAADAGVVGRYGVRAVVTLFPQCSNGCGVPVKSAPVQFVAGDMDGIAPWQSTRESFSSSRANKTFAKLPGFMHHPTAQQWSKTLVPATASFLKCALSTDQKSCGAAFDGQESCTYSCSNCGCDHCAPCLPCWGSSPPAWCASKCASCSACRKCDACSSCRTGS